MRGEMINGWDKVLTKRQQDVLSFAVERGYYLKCASIKINDLAEEMGISRSTFGGHLQYAEKAVLHKVGSDLN